MRRLDPAQARELFTAARVARLATVTPDGRPHLVPVTAAVVDDGSRGAVCFAVDNKPKRTRQLRRLTNIATHPEVAFLADHYDDDWSRLWWVRADGTAQILDDPAHARHRTAIAALQAKYAQYREAAPDGPVVWTAVTRWSGWASSPAGPLSR